MTPAEAGFLRSIEFVTMVVLGGMASTFGSVIGAAILTVLPQLLVTFSDYKHMVLNVDKDRLEAGRSAGEPPAR